MSDHTTPEDHGILLVLYLIDLRAQYEAALRTLTSVQRHLEQHRARGSDEARLQFKHLVAPTFSRLDATNESVRDALREAIRQVGLLPPKE